MTYTEPLNPVQIEHAIRDTATRIGNLVRECSDRYAAFLEADREYDAAFARALLSAPGAIGMRKYHAELATTEQRKDRDVADVAYRYADRRAKALENELRAWQSVGASIREQYRMAGRGES